MLFFTSILALYATQSVVMAQSEPLRPDADGRYTLEAEGIKAQFIPYGATLTNLFVKDKNGIERDIVLGYDNTSYYPVDPGHPVYNAIPGRYVNRIGKGQFKIDNVTYHTPLNDGPNTLHGGTNNWSYRTWEVKNSTNSSITFGIDDPSNSTGMPGRVLASVTYSVSKNKWSIVMDAMSPEHKTPIMLTQHTYFQLDAFANPENRTIWNHTLYMPEAKRVLEADANALPTGVIADVAPGDMSDFASTPRALGFASDRAEFENHCGAGCHGYNGAWAFNENRDKSATVLTLSSRWSGIQAELTTNQDAVVLYTCNWNDGKTDFKSTQGVAGQDRKIPRDGCIAIEAHDYVDGINHPEWGRLEKQIFGPGQEYHWSADWTFGTM
ncbi:similar to aldose 1-epimerase [Plenodomus lingam JN3]|uniref:Similar to aldose 1-epimerase n=2 Tax=Leptosphaeria maculans TaxID=5022 RepID=E5A928_LEPMJ|nr:similar to aldose 1-epimerase [Plenodomus lingam JN3]CBY00123.1 similar to aldose 1-epimerase [Plenodomus lingam JN3]